METKYVLYKNKPLVRKDNVIIYGDMDSKYYLQLLILSETKDEFGNDVPDNILVQVINSKNKNDIIKQDFKKGLYESLDLGVVWLTRYNNE